MTAAVKDALGKVLKKIFDIREGELSRAVLMQFNFFLVISSLLIVKPAVNALFLSKIGVEQLPIAFVLVAIFAALISRTYSRGLARITLIRIIIRTLSIAVGSLVFFGVLLRLNFLEGWVLYLFYVWVAIFGVLTASQFWILANIVFNVREAKRLFGFIGAGAITGGIFGGYLTTLLAPALGSENLLFVAALLIAGCIPISRAIWKHNVPAHQAERRQKRRVQRPEERPLHLIRNSRHLTFLAAIIGLSVIVAKLVDYQFSAIASARIADPDALTAFFGFWFSSFNLISLLIQLFLTKRVVGVLGVGISLFFLPIGIILGAVMVFFAPMLWAAVFIKMSDGSLKQSINKAAIELLSLPIPLEVKNQTKTFIDVLVDSVATGIGGIILIFLVKGLDLSTQAISLMILALTGLWIYLVMQVRKEYMGLFKLKIAEAAPNGTVPDISNESVLGGFRKVLAEGAEKQILYVLRKIREQPDDRLFADIRSLLKHESGYVRAEALRNLYYFKDHPILEDVEPLTQDATQKVKIRAFEYLIQFSGGEKTAVIDRYLHEKDHRVKGAALVSLALEARDNPDLKRIFHLEERIDAELNQLQQIEESERRRFQKIGLLKAIGYANIPRFFPIIEDFFDDPDKAVASQAILSAGETLHPPFLSRLISFLAQGHHQEPAATALANFGPEIIDHLRQTSRNPEIQLSVKQAMPLVLEKIGTQSSVNLLFDLIDHPDLLVRMQTLRALNNLKINFPYLNFNRKDIFDRILQEARLFRDTLSALYAQNASFKNRPPTDQEREEWTARRKLIELLEKRLDRNLERIFRLLGLKYPPGDVLDIYQSLQSKRADLRINALEFLDNLLEPNLKKVLIPIVETALLDSISEDALRQLDVKIPDEYQCFEMLLMGADPRIKLAVLHLIAQLKDRRFLSLAKAKLNSEDEKVRTAAEEAVDILT